MVHVGMRHWSTRMESIPRLLQLSMGTLLMWGLVLSSLVVSVFLFKFLRPHPLVRFSENCLVIDDADIDGDGINDGMHLTFRLARESYYPLLDCRATVKAVMRRRIGKGGNVVPLKLVLSEVHKLEYWEVWHAIDEESPLFGNLDLLKMIYVQVTAFDTSYKQEVRLSHEYPTSTLRMGLEFAPMIAGGFGSEVPTTFVDHSKLDRLVLSIPDDDDDDNDGTSRATRLGVRPRFESGGSDIEQGKDERADAASQARTSTSSVADGDSWVDAGKLEV